MSKQTQSYIEDMKRMYEILTKKKDLSFVELSFLETYEKTMVGVM